MIGEPKLEDRPEQPYAGIRTQTRIRAFPRVIPTLLDEIFDWLGEHDITPAGPPFMRYHVINMAAQLDVELGVPVATPIAGDDRVKAGTLPAGKYAALVYTGSQNGIEGNKALLDWGRANDIRWDRWDDPNGDAFRSRVEFYLTDPDDEPDPAKWETEVAILVAEG